MIRGLASQAESLSTRRTTSNERCIRSHRCSDTSGRHSLLRRLTSNTPIEFHRDTISNVYAQASRTYVLMSILLCVHDRAGANPGGKRLIGTPHETEAPR